MLQLPLPLVGLTVISLPAPGKRTRLGIRVGTPGVGLLSNATIKLPLHLLASALLACFWSQAFPLCILLLKVALSPTYPSHVAIGKCTSNRKIFAIWRKSPSMPSALQQTSYHWQKIHSSAAECGHNHSSGISS